MEKSSNEPSIVFVVANDQISIINAAIVAQSENLLSNPNFSVDNIFIVNSNLISEIHLESYDRIYVIGLNEQNVNERVLNSFLVNNYKKLYFWYSESKFEYTLKVFLKEIKLKNLYSNINPEKYLSLRKLFQLDYAELLGAYIDLKKNNEITTELASKFKHSLYAANIYDRLFSEKSEFKPITRKIMQKLFKISLGFDSCSVNTMIEAYHEIRENNHNSIGIMIDHHKLGTIEVVNPKNDLVDRKTFFKNLNIYSAIAVAALDKDPSGNIYEVCLNKKTASKIDWNEIPYLKKINSCRFLVNKKFVLEKSLNN